jgi:hypothetical protein
VWTEDVDLVQCAAVGDVVSADVVTELFKAASVAFVDDSSKLV